MKPLSAFLMSLMAVIACYLFFAFILWDIDASNWDGAQRGTCAILTVFISILIYYANVKD